MNDDQMGDREYWVAVKDPVVRQIREELFDSDVPPRYESLIYFALADRAEELGLLLIAKRWRGIGKQLVEWEGK